MLPRTPIGPRFPLREPPYGDAAAYLSRQLSAGPWAIRATVTLHQPADAVAKIIWPGMGALETVDADHCRLHLGGESYAELAWMVAVIGIDFTVIEPPGLVEAVGALGGRCLKAV
jgi:hypothetical protein